MPKTPQTARATTAQRKEDAPKKRTYTVLEDGVPEAAAFLVIEKGFSVAHAARILHAKRKALSKHVQKFRENRERLRAPRRVDESLLAKAYAVGQAPVAVNAAPDALENTLSAAGGAVAESTAATGDVVVGMAAFGAEAVAMRIQASNDALLSEQPSAVADSAVSESVLANQLQAAGEGVVTVAVDSTAVAGVAIADCTCCARCQDWKKLQQQP